MNSEVQIRVRYRARARVRAARVALAVLAVLGAGGVLLAATRLFDDPPRIEGLRVENPSEYDIYLTTASSNEGGVLPLGVAKQRCVTEFHDVIDQGQTWVLAFYSQGVDGGHVSITRAQLVNDGWQVTIPDEAITRLRDGGAPAPPTRECSAR